MAAFCGRVSIDLGTGDGRLPYILAGLAPERLFIGIDASIAGLRSASVRAARARVTNVLYVRSAVEALPPELFRVADHITAILPWGSLLAALARPVAPTLASVRALCQDGARLTVVVGVDPERDRAEARRLDLPDLTAAHLEGELAAGYTAAGFRVCAVRPLAAEELARWPSSWAKRLAFGQARPVFQIEARCEP